MTAFEHLEQELRAGVRRAHGSAEPPRHRPWRLVVAAGFVALALAAAALAATGTIQIGHVHEDEPASLRPRPHVGPGIRAGRARTLPLRVADPAGGPPWTLRVFGSSRGGHCVQIGQVVRGHFGVFVPPGTLEPLNAWPGGSSSLCSGAARNGFPVVRGLQRILVIGGASDPRRCPGQPSGDCPITSVTLLRYGLLGPGARRVRLVAGNGAELASARTGPRIGGAYLFAVAQPVARYVRANRSVRPYLRTPDVGVIAMFANGQTLRVAGHHRFAGSLPGLGTPSRGYAPAPPPKVPVAVRVENPGRFAVITLSFRAPVAISRFDVHYTQTLRGPIGRTCTPTRDGYNATTRDIAAGQIVRFTLRRGPGFRENGREGWCPGRFTGAIRYSTPGRNTTIGRFAFTIR
jgi:hypothetical protein